MLNCCARLYILLMLSFSCDHLVTVVSTAMTGVGMPLHLTALIGSLVPVQ